MNAQRQQFLNSRLLPGRLNTQETSWFLGFNEHDIPVLVSAGLLKPLGRPPQSGSKYFAGTELLALRDDPRWLAKASDATVNFWKNKNASRSLSGKSPDVQSSIFHADGH